MFNVDGNVQIIEDNQAYYSKDTPYQLLCPHSWRETYKHKCYDNDVSDFCAFSMVDDGYTLVTNQGKTTIHAPLDMVTNLPTVATTGNYKTYHAFANAFCEPALIKDDDDTVTPKTMKIYVEDSEGETDQHPIHFERVSEATKQAEDNIEDFELTPNRHEQPKAIDDPVTHRDEGLFMSWHMKLNHLPYKTMK